MASPPAAPEVKAENRTGGGDQQALPVVRSAPKPGYLPP